MFIQFVLGLVILRWDKGLAGFEWIGTQATIFLDYTDHGSIFVFGERYTDHEFIMNVSWA